MRKIILTTTLASLALPLTPAMARTYSGWTVRTTIMRAGPDYGYPAVQRIGRNAQVGIYGCLNDWSWCDVGYRYDRGWVAGRDLVANYQGRRQGISSYLGIGILSFMFGNYWDNHYRNRTFYNQRSRWERHYYDNYQSHWGPRPNTPPVYQNRTRVNAPIPAQPVPDRNRRNPGVNQNRGKQISVPQRNAGPQANTPPVSPNRTRVNAPPAQNQPRGAITPQARPTPDRSRNNPGAAQNRANQTSTPQPTARPPAPVGQRAAHDNQGNKAKKKDKHVDQTKPH